jgi:glycosyltransferase involved in cell wall biosynthesis
VSGRPRVVLLRGHSANPWELGAWELLRDRFDVTVAVTGRNPYDLSGVELARTRARTLRDLIPGGRVADLAVHVPGDRYLGLERLLAGADIVHSAELGWWFSAQPAALKERLGFRLVLTVWETIPFIDRFLDPVRARRVRRGKPVSLDAADLYLAATERARRALVLEGAAEDRVVVSPPGIDTARFAGGAGAGGDGHLVVSPGRLVWEKGHQDVLRALCALGGDHRLLVVGAGRERDRLLAHAAELGMADRFEIRAVPYEDMPALYASASAVVLASLTLPIWEEQFGMVLAEALAAGAPIVAASSGAIPEVLEGTGAALVSPGDWPGLARALAAGPLTRPPGQRVAYDQTIVRRYSNEAAAERLGAAYDRVLAG